MGMKALRVFFQKHVIQNSAGIHPSYKKTPMFDDFPESTDPQQAYRELFRKHGAVTDSKEYATILTGEKTLVAPGTCITINSHTIVDLDREKAQIESERVIEQSLFDGTELFAAQSRKPEPKYEPRGRK